MLRWSQNSTPISRAFDDIYYARSAGLAESRYVFLKHNGIPDRWDHTPYFHIAELGFGAGLNFFATLDLWRQRRNRKARLHFSSFEKFPLKPNEIRKALSAWPELEEVSRSFLLEYEDLPRGVHRLELEDQNTILDLWIGDALESLTQFQTPVDAWYFDGFSPKKNPDLWTKEIFQEASRVAKLDSTFATYAAASFVRQHLEAADYCVDKAPGFGRKRDMLTGRLAKKKITLAPLSYPHRNILGGGIAGLSLASRFFARNEKARLNEVNEDFFRGGSGNPLALVMPNLSSSESALSLFSLQSTLYTLRQYQRWQRAGHECGWHSSGILQLLNDSKKEERFLLGLAAHRIPPSLAQLVSRDEASDIAGIKIHSPAIFWRKSGYVEPHTLKEILLKNSGPSFTTSKDKAEETPSVICTAEAALGLSSLKDWPWKFQRGQISFWQTPDSLRKLRVPIVYGGYALPEHKQRMIAGSTYNSPELGSGLIDADHAKITDQAEAALHLRLTPEISGGRASNRLGLRDALPVVGPCEAQLLNIGYGSKGFSHALLAGELLASECLGIGVPLQTKVREALLARRFAIQNQAVLSS